MRGLVRPTGRTPIWVFVEVGHPFTESDAPTIEPHQVRDAVWSGIIHGARGVAYFNHNFGGDCISQHVLRDECGRAVRPVVTKLNRTIERHAPLLNSPFVDGLVEVRGALDVAVKLYRGRFFLLVGRKTNDAAHGSVRFRCGHPTSAVETGTGKRRAISPTSRLRHRCSGV